MRIAYVAHWLGSIESGVLKKIQQQMKCWTNFNCKVELFLFTKVDSDAAKIPESISDIPIHKYFYKNGITKIKATSALADAIQHWSPDVVYLRQCKYYPSLGRMAKQHPVIMEVNSNDLAEIRRSSYSARIYHFLTRGFLLNKVLGMVFVTRELSATKIYSRFCKPFTVIGNGIDLREYRKLPISEGNPLSVVFIGSPGMPWHGIDRVVEMASMLSDISFEIIGLTASDITPFCRNGSLPSNIRAHGFLERKVYETIFERSSVAIGSLAMERAGLKEGSVLKVREYLAYGLPVIIGYEDTDFINLPPFILHVKSNNLSRDHAQIRDFIEYWRGRRIPREEIGHLDVMEKERKRLDFMSSIQY